MERGSGLLETGTERDTDTDTDTDTDLRYAHYQTLDSWR